MAVLRSSLSSHLQQLLLAKGVVCLSLKLESKPMSIVSFVFLVGAFVGRLCRSKVLLKALINSGVCNVRHPCTQIKLV
ncbi:hypothetical protein Scep_029913 [Stephania cephalantha]|uniref:Uncharacterized protein n=1 Tax=Stephania cephalantha TaxID=152367 RepID=A0AAP0HG23_9MAGN